MTVPVPLDLSALLTAHLPPSPSPEDDPADLDYCDVCGMRWPCDTRTLVRALRIAVEALREVAVDHEAMPVNDGRDWCSKCQNYMRGDSGCTAADARAALAAVRELVDLGEKPCPTCGKDHTKDTLCTN